MANMTHAERVASEVRAAMARRRLDQGDLASALNLSRAAVSRRLTGLVDFSVTELYIVADLLEIPVSALLPVERVA